MTLVLAPQPTRSPRGLPDRRRVVLVGSVLMLAALAAMVRLDDQPLWFDELATVRAASLSWAGLHVLLGRTDANIGLYYVGEHLWRGLGHGPGVLRLPSALATVVTVGLTERIGRRLIGQGPALLAAALLAVQPFATAYARDARPYALVGMCATAALLLGLRAVERPGAGPLLAYTAVGSLAVCLHLYAVLVVLSYGLALLPGRGHGRMRWVVANLGVLVVTVPVLYVSLHQQGQLHWVPGLSPGRVLSGLSLLAGGALPLGLLVLAVLLASRALASGGTRLLPARTCRVLLAGLVLPVLALLAASTVAPTFVPRYLVGTVPLECLLLAAGVATLGRGAWRVALVTTLAGWFAVTTVVQATQSYRYEDYRAASRLVLVSAQPGDAVVYLQQGARLGMAYYLPRVVRPGEQVPGDVLELPGSGADSFAVGVLDGAPATSALVPHPRVWVVRLTDSVAASVPALRRYACLPDRRFGLVAVALCTRRAAT